MALLRFKDLCVDAVDDRLLGDFWAATLGLQQEPDDPATLRGPSPQHTVWINAVPEPVSVKQRVHLDVHVHDVDELTARGARVLVEREGWTVLADPEGGELCAFVRAEPPPYRLYEVGVDTADPARIAAWWGELFGVEPQSEAGVSWHWIEPPGAPFEGFVFVPVPEPKTVKNRIHWDVAGPALQPVLDAGATLLRARGDDIRWDVLADPDGNEFCLFTD